MKRRNKFLLLAIPVLLIAGIIGVAMQPHTGYFRTKWLPKQMDVLESKVWALEFKWLETQIDAKYEWIDVTLIEITPYGLEIWVIYNPEPTVAPDRFEVRSFYNRIAQLMIDTKQPVAYINVIQELGGKYISQGLFRLVWSPVSYFQSVTSDQLIWKDAPWE